MYSATLATISNACGSCTSSMMCKSGNESVDAQMCTNSKLVASPAFIHMLPCTIHVLGNSSKTTYYVQVRHMHIFVQLPQVFTFVQPRYVCNPGTYSKLICCASAAQIHVLRVHVLVQISCVCACLCNITTDSYVWCNSDTYSYSRNSGTYSYLCNTGTYSPGAATGFGATPEYMYIRSTPTHVFLTPAHIHIFAQTGHIHILGTAPARMECYAYSRSFGSYSEVRNPGTYFSPFI